MLWLLLEFSWFYVVFYLFSFIFFCCPSVLSANQILRFRRCFVCKSQELYCPLVRSLAVLVVENSRNTRAKIPIDSLEICCGIFVDWRTQFLLFYRFRITSRMDCIIVNVCWYIYQCYCHFLLLVCALEDFENFEIVCLYGKI